MPQLPLSAWRRPAAVGAMAALALAASAGAALAWGATGHRLIGEAGTAELSPALPAFLHTPYAIFAIGEGAREPDRSRQAGAPHDHDLDPGHFVDVDDQGLIQGGPALAALPRDKEAYIEALRAVNSDPYKAGYLPYNIEDGFEQAAKDFAYWRVDAAALKAPRLDAADRAWIENDLKARQGIIIRDIGYWAHFVGDASQPLHVSVHHNGWGDYPNPDGFTDDKLHGPIEGAFVRAHVTLASVEAAMAPPAPCAPIAACTVAYLTTTTRYVKPVYALWKAGDFARDDPKAVAFITARVAAGAAELRDMIEAAWALSATESVGYQPEISVRAAEAGAPVPMAALLGSD